MPPAPTVALTPRPAAPAPVVDRSAEEAGAPIPQAAPDSDAAESVAAASLFPIVGIGASAGGLEALDQFLRNVPDEWDAAFVIVQHHDPAHGHMLVDVLRNMSRLDVVEAADGTRVEPRRVYVIPPGKNMSLLHGTLHLLPQAPDPGRVLPIDFFFRSLAHDQGERSVGVILSGWAATARSACARSRRPPASRSCSRRARRSSTACRAARSTPGWPTWCCRSTSCRGGSSRTAITRSRRRPPPRRAYPPRRARSTRSACCSATTRATTSRSTSAARSTGGSSAGWACTRSTTTPSTCGSCASTRRRSRSCSASC